MKHLFANAMKVILPLPLAKLNHDIGGGVTI